MSDEDLMAAFGRRVDTLCEMAQELGIPPEEAAQIIEDAMYASLRKGNLDTDRFLAASMRSAAKRRTERAR